MACVGLTKMFWNAGLTCGKAHKVSGRLMLVQPKPGRRAYRSACGDGSALRTTILQAQRASYKVRTT
jgi:hypothetical protein